MLQQDPRSPSGSWLFSTAKALVELVLIWDAVGYIALRAFCNYHDVPLIPNLGFERYLQETYALLSSLIISKAQSEWFPIAILAIAGIAFLLTRFPISRIERPLHKLLSERVVSGILVVLVILSAIGFGQVTVSLMKLENDSFVGALHTPMNAGGAYVDRAVLLAVLIWASWYFFRPNENLLSPSGVTQGQRVLRRLLFVFGLLTVIFIPIVYGASLQDREFYIVKIKYTDGTDSPLGMRLLESATQVVYWSAESKIGLVQSIPVSKIASVDYLCVADDVAKQMERASQGLKAPACM